MNADGAGLVYVMGPSGAGKDTLMAWVRERTQGLPVAFAHRYVTRPPEAGGENHVALTEAEFLLREEAGLFALSWRANGLRYGLGLEIETWMRAGLTVVANGSRAYLPRCLARYPLARPVLVTAPPEVLAGRLAGRGRENGRDLAARLERAAALDVSPFPEAAVVVNDGSVGEAGAELLALVLAARP